MKIEMKRVTIFCVISFILAYSLAMYVYSLGGLSSPSYIVICSFIMFTPLVANLLTRLITKEGFKNTMLRPNLKKRNIKFYLLAWLAPFFLIILGIVVYYIIFPAKFDPTLTTLNELLTNQAVSLEQPVPNYTTSVLWQIVLVQMVQGLFLSPLFNGLATLGEEFGWRAYLLPKLNAQFGTLKAILFSGIIWGLWHAPLIAMGHNYGTDYPLAPWLGIFAMVVFCIVLATFESYVTLKTGSVWPAVITHAVLNGSAGLSLLFNIKEPMNPFIGPTSVGIIGGIGFIIVSLILIIHLAKHPISLSKVED